MKELCEPSVNRTQFTFFTQFPLRWTSPQSLSGVDILAVICWTHPQSVSTDDILANLCWTPPKTYTHTNKNSTIHFTTHVHMMFHE